MPVALQLDDPGQGFGDLTVTEVDGSDRAANPDRAVEIFLPSATDEGHALPA